MGLANPSLIPLWGGITQTAPTSFPLVDVSPYVSKVLELDMTSFQGQIVIEGTNDGVNFFPLLAWYSQTLAFGLFLAQHYSVPTNGVETYSFIQPFKFINIQVDTTFFVGGSVAARIYGLDSPVAFPSDLGSLGSAQKVQGASANGGTPFNPVLVAGQDATPLVRTLLTQSDGSAITDPRGHTVRPSVQPIITAAGYTAGQALGGVMTFAAGRQSGVSGAVSGGVINEVIITDTDLQDAQLELWLFNQTLGTPPTDHTTCNFAAADLSNIVGIIAIPSSAYFKGGTHVDAAVIENVGMPFLPNSGANIYGQLVNRGTPTYTTTGSLKVMLAVLQD